MVKINLLNIPEGQEVEAPPRRREEAPPADETKFDIAGLEETTFHEPEPEARPEPPRVEPVPEREANPFKTTVFEDTEEPPPAVEGAERFDDTVPRKLHYKILGGVGVILLLLLAFFALRPLFTSSPQAEQPPTARSGAATPAGEAGSPGENISPQTSALPPVVQTRYAGNTAANNFRLGLAERFLSITSGNVQPILVVVTSGYAFISVAGDSRDAITQYQKALRASVAGAQLSAEGMEKKTIAGRSKYVADFALKTGPIPGAGAAVSVSQIQRDEQLPAQLRSLAQRHKVSVRYLKKGDSERSGQFQQTYYYLKIQGSRAAVLPFLKELTQSYPALNLSKLSLFAAPGQPLSRSTNMNANVELLFYRPL